jgi:hypothetical protein
MWRPDREDELHFQMGGLSLYSAYSMDSYDFIYFLVLIDVMISPCLLRLIQHFNFLLYPMVF